MYTIILKTHLQVNVRAYEGRPGGSDGKESACSAGGPGSITGLGNPLEKELINVRSSREGENKTFNYMRHSQVRR